MADPRKRSFEYFLGSDDPRIKQNWLTDKMGLTTPPPPPIPAEPLSSYPSQEDAKYAIQQGFGYGSGNEPYIAGQRANIYDRPQKGDLGDVIAAPSTNTDLTQYRNLAELGKINTLHAQAALAANRNPIAALGYDPEKTVLQTKLGPMNIAGAYSPEQDRTFVNVTGDRQPSTPVHESIHRGLEQLRANPEARQLIRELPNEEALVRYIMATQMGNPEQGTGEIADEQRTGALNYFNRFRYMFEPRLKRAEEIAAEMRKERRPGGPR